MIGDQIDRDVQCAHNSGVRSIFYAANTEYTETNYENIGKRVIPDFSIIDFRQLPFVIEEINRDIQFLDAQKDEIRLNYRQYIKDLPSSQRIKVGLLQDGDGQNQNSKFLHCGILQED